MDEIEQLKVAEGTDEGRNYIQNEEENGHERHPLAGTLANILRSARGLGFVSAAQGWGEREKGKWYNAGAS